MRFSISVDDLYALLHSVTSQLMWDEIHIFKLHVCPPADMFFQIAGGRKIRRARARIGDSGQSEKLT